MNLGKHLLAYRPHLHLGRGAHGHSTTTDLPPKSRLSGNIVISLLVGAVILYGASAVGGLHNRYLVDLRRGLLTNLAREMVKDCMDMEADEGSRQPSHDLRQGEKVRMAAYVVIMGALVCLYVPLEGPFSSAKSLCKSLPF